MSEPNHGLQVLIEYLTLIQDSGGLSYDDDVNDVIASLVLTVVLGRFQYSIAFAVGPVK